MKIAIRNSPFIEVCMSSEEERNGSVYTSVGRPKSEKRQFYILTRAIFVSIPLLYVLNPNNLKANSGTISDTLRSTDWYNLNGAVSSPFVAESAGEGGSI